MSFNQSRARPVARPSSPSAPVMAVGQRVFVHTPGSRSASVSLGDVSGKLLSGVHLVDGTEVEVIAWRPQGPRDTRYRVRVAHGADGWLPAENLRKTLVAPPAAPPAPTQATVAADPNRGRFGQRRHPDPVRASEPAAPVADTGGRRFGQRF